MINPHRTQRALCCLQGHHGTITSLAFTADGRHIISGSEDGTLRLWDLATQRELFAMLAHTTSIYGVTGAPDGQWIASASQTGHVVVWDRATRQPLARFDQGLALCSRTIACSPDGRYLLLGNDDGLLWRWTWQTNAKRCLLGHTRPIVGVALAIAGTSPGEESLAVSLAHDARLCLWHLDSGALLKTIMLDSNYGEPLGISLALAPNGKLAATSSAAVAIDIWELATGQRLATLDQMAGNVLTLVFSPDNQHLLAASSVEGIEGTPGEPLGRAPTLRLWKIATGKAVAQFVGHSGSIHALAISPDGRHFVSGSSDQTIRLWAIPR